MAQNRRKTTMIRVPDDLVERLDASADRLTAQLGISVNRTSALEYLIRAALAQIDADDARKTGGGAR